MTEIFRSRARHKEQYGRSPEATSPFCRADIENLDEFPLQGRLPNLPTCDYSSQTHILWPVSHGWPCWECELPQA